MRPLAAYALLIGIFGACGGGPAISDGWFFPTDDRSAGGGLAGYAEGVLVGEDGCIWLQQDEGRYLPIWPRGTSLVDSSDGLRVVTSDRSIAILVGSDRVALGGGESPSRDLIEEAIGTQIPDSCAKGKLWSVSTLEQIGR